MRAWSEDSRLDEIVDGLRHVFFPLPKGIERGKTRHSNGRMERDMWEERIIRHGNGVHENRDHQDRLPSRRTPIEPAKTLPPVPAILPYLDRSPSIKVICACRIHPALFAGIVGTGPMPPPPVVVMPLPPPPPPIHNHRPIDIPTQPPPEPVNEGEPFRGFTIQDLRAHDVKRSGDDEIGTTKAARTPFTNKDKILLSFEVYTLESSKARGVDGVGGRADVFTG